MSWFRAHVTGNGFVPVSPVEDSPGRSSGVREVLPRGLCLGWEAEIWNPFNGVWVELGVFDTRELAAQAYERAVQELTEQTKEVLSEVLLSRNYDTIQRIQPSWIEAALSQWGADSLWTCARLQAIGRFVLKQGSIRTWSGIYRSDKAVETVEQINRDFPRPCWNVYEDFAFEMKMHSATMELPSLRSGIYRSDKAVETVEQINRDFPRPCWNVYEDFAFEMKMHSATMELPSLRSGIYRSDKAVETVEQINRDFPRPCWNVYEDFAFEMKMHSATMELPSLKPFAILAFLRPSPTPDDFIQCTIDDVSFGSLYPAHHAFGGPGNSCAADSEKQDFLDLSILTVPNHTYYLIGCDDFRIKSTDVRDSFRETLLPTSFLSKQLYAMLPILKGVGGSLFRTLRNLRSIQSGGPSIVRKGLGFLKSAGKLALPMVILSNTPLVGAAGAMAPDAAEPGSLQAANLENSSTLIFGAIASFGIAVPILLAIGQCLVSRNYGRRPDLPVTSAASARAGEMLNRLVNLAQTDTIEQIIQYRELTVARHEATRVYTSFTTA